MIHETKTKQIEREKRTNRQCLSRSTDIQTYGIDMNNITGILKTKRHDEEILWYFVQEFDKEKYLREIRYHSSSAKWWLNKKEFKWMPTDRQEADIMWSSGIFCSCLKMQQIIEINLDLFALQMIVLLKCLPKEFVWCSRYIFSSRHSRSQLN